MENKLCLITGANSGIGKSTALKLASKGTYILMLCRNEEKAEKARQEIISETGNRGVEILIADLSLQYDIRRVVKDFYSRFGKLDILINNAGTIVSKRELTIDNIEKTIAVNHIAPFLLTNLLLDALHAAPAARVVNVSSEAHRLGASIFDPDDLQLEQNFSPMKAYGVSKLYNIMFTHELAKRTRNTPIVTNALHPGTVNTNLADEASWLMKLMFFIGTPFLRSPDKGSETSVYLASAPEAGDISGKYFKNKKEISPASEARNDDYSERLWEESEKLSELN